MNGREQIVLGPNAADNVAACIRALMTHSHVHWVRNQLVTAELRTVWVRRRVDECESLPDGVTREYELSPSGRGGEHWHYRGEWEGFRLEKINPNWWGRYELRPYETLVFEKAIDKTSMIMLLSEAADFFHAKRRKLTPTSVPASLVRLLLEVGTYEPFPLLGTYDRYNIRKCPKVLVFSPDEPAIWAPRGEGLAHYVAAHEARMRRADVDRPEGLHLVESDEPTGFVYFIGRADGEGLVKIGYSDDPERRLGELQTGSPVELAIIGYVPGSEGFEQELHVRLAANRRHGEWFERHAALELLIDLQRRGA